MGKFTYTDPQSGITLFQRHLQGIQAAKTAPPALVVKSDSDQAWDKVVDAARYLISKGAASTVPTAVDLLRTANHPTYQAWDQAMRTRPLTSTAIAKTAVPAQIQKRNAVMAEITKRASAMVRSGQAANEEEARSQLFKADRALYNEYRDLSYAKGPAVPPLPREGFQSVEPGPVLQQVKALARELVLDDAWGKYTGLDETAMLGEVFKLYPSLWKAYREEVMGPGEAEPPTKPRGAARA